MQSKITQIDEKSIAENFLWGLWRSISEDYKDRYKREIWEHFENAIRSASYTDSLKIFISNFQKRIPVEIQAKYTKKIIEIVESNKDYDILNMLRSETTYLVMIVRFMNQERKEKSKQNNSTDLIEHNEEDILKEFEN